MAKKATPTRIVGTIMELMDGGTCRLVLNYGLMRAMSRKHPEAYKATNEVLGGGKTPSYEEVYQIIYMAYLCGCAYDHTEAMPEEDFYVQAGGDYAGAIGVFKELIDPNHRTPTAGRS